MMMKNAQIVHPLKTFNLRQSLLVFDLINVKFIQESEISCHHPNPAFEVYGSRRDYFEKKVFFSFSSFFLSKGKQKRLPF